MESFIKRPTHALIIEGRPGSGKHTLALHLIARLLKIDRAKLSNSSHVLLVAPNNKTISIDAIRNLREFVKLKTMGRAKIKRVVLLETAETMTTEAQNALLKLLEEPPLDTVLLLTSAKPAALLPTIRSRVQKLVITQPNKEHVCRYFVAQGKASQEIDKAYLISQGHIGLMSSILNGEQTGLLEQIKYAKQLLTKNKFEQLIEVDNLTKQKDSFGQFLQALTIICQVAMLQASEHHKTVQVKHWHGSMKTIVLAEASYLRQANLKLLCTDLLLNL